MEGKVMSYRWGFNNLEFNDQFYISSGGFEQTSPTHQYGPIGRSGYMLHCVTAGHGYFTSNDHTYYVGKGDMFFIQPNKTITMKADPSDPWSFYWIRFIGNLVPKYMKRINLDYKHPMMKQEDLPGVFSRIIGIVEYSKYEGRKDFYYQAKMFEILDLLQKAYPTEYQSKYRKKEDIFRVARHYLTNHIDEAVSVSDLVDYLNIDRTYLYRIFKRNINKSPQEFINEYKLEKASELLKSAEGTIQYVALSSGFKSYQTFFKMFKKTYGISPQEYRKKYALKDTAKSIRNEKHK